MRLRTIRQSFTYPAGVIPYLGGNFLGSNWTSQTNQAKYVLLGTGLGVAAAVSYVPSVLKIGYTSGNQTTENSALLIDQATARAGGWLMHSSATSSSAAEILYGSANNRLTDPGNVAFQNALKTKIQDFLTANPTYKGVYFDNFNPGLQGGVGFNTSYPVYDQAGNLLYSNNAEWQAAEIAMIANVGAALKNAGCFVGVNAAGKIFGCSGICETESMAWMDQYAPYVTSGFYEFYLQKFSATSGKYEVGRIEGAACLPADAASVNHWNGLQAIQRHANTLGVGWSPFENYAPATDPISNIRYLNGSFLLEWNGVPLSSSYQGGAITWIPNSNVNIWNAEFDKDIGLPTGPKVQVQTDIWARPFSKGYIVVNPTCASASGTYLGNAYTVAAGDAAIVVTG